MLIPIHMGQHGGRKVTETSVIEFCHRNKLFLPVFTLEINTSSRARTVTFKRTLLQNEETCRVTFIRGLTSTAEG